jgi:hypothetical protein
MGIRRLLSFGARLWLVGLVWLLAGTAPASAAFGAGGGGGASDDLASALVGTWEGTKSGAEGGKFESREWRIVFQESTANAVIGTKQYKQPNGKWSKRERVNAVIDAAGHIWAVDTDGVLNGSVSDTGTLELIYQEPGTKDAAAVIALLERTGD